MKFPVVKKYRKSGLYVHFTATRVGVVVENDDVNYPGCPVGYFADNWEWLPDSWNDDDRDSEE